MTDSSGLEFEHIRLKSLIDFIKIINESETKDKSHVERVYSFNHADFPQALNFCKNFGFIKEEGTRILALVRPDFLVVTLINALPEICQIYPSMRRFVDKFSYTDGQYKFKPNLTQKIEFTNERIFLSEASVLTIDGDELVLSGGHLAKDIFRRKISLQVLQASLIDKAIIGEDAEKYVFDYENNIRDKKFEFLQPTVVERISEKDVSAGYDILSFDKEAAAKGVYSPIFIEVKAISRQDDRFIWTANEMEVASEFGDAYYLYLVRMPIIDDPEQVVRKICNPYRNVYNNPLWGQRALSIEFREKELG